MHKYMHGWKFLTQWVGFPLSASTWEPPKNFKIGPDNWNEDFVDYCNTHGLDIKGLSQPGQARPQVKDR